MLYMLILTLKNQIFYMILVLSCFIMFYAFGVKCGVNKSEPKD